MLLKIWYEWGSNTDLVKILKIIDSNLQKTNIENSVDNDKSSLLPINFFLNVNYNSAINFTVGKR